MGFLGMIALGTGTVAVFVTDNGAGSATLLGVGTLLLLVSAVGRVRSFKGAGFEADFSHTAVAEAVEGLAAIGGNVETAAVTAKAKGNEQLAGAAMSASTGIGKLSTSLERSVKSDASSVHRPVPDLSLLAQETEDRLGAFIAEWIETETVDPPRSIELEARSVDTGIVWDVVLTWTEPDLVVFIEVKLALTDRSGSALRTVTRRVYERAALEIASGVKERPFKEVIIVIMVPGINDTEFLPRVQMPDNLTAGISTVIWDGSSDTVTRAVEDIRARFRD